MFLMSKTLNIMSRTVVGTANTNFVKLIFPFIPERQNTSINYIKKHCSTVVNKEEDINYNDVTNGDKELEHKLKVLMLEAEVMRQEGKAVPEHNFLREKHWKEILNLSSRSARQKYLEYLFKLSKRKEHEKVKKEEKRLAFEEFLAKKEAEPKKEETIEEFALQYDLQHNNLFLRVYDTTINQLYNNRLIQAMQFGQKLVIDCGYDVNMTKRENLNCAKQFMLLFAENRLHNDPFDIHFCNANKKGDLIKQFYKYIPTIDEPWFPLNLHEASYLDLYPKDQLVYLTPHCREEIREYDHDAVYIVGGIVDKVNQEPLSLAKAKREGIRMAKLPLDRHLQWGAGSGKSLTLNQVVAILLDQKMTGDWQHSLRHVPKRKLMEESTLRAIEQTYNRRKQTQFKPQWKPSRNVNFDNLGFNNRSKKSFSSNNKAKRTINVNSLLEE
ncbi:mitochondrial ribonuclease P protein 1 homolog [Diabrotica undecimpunctata]|uniref:mitochondrial ribonuclease P protein 1 homolog n=1 Tax=Diabrotica undecimpunctata TaxID=50387 RepID=UPI003B638B1B